MSAATCAGLVAWAAGEMTLNFFRPTPREIGSGVAAYTPTDNTPYLLAKRRVAIQNAALHYGILGASVGLALGMAGGSLRPSVKNAVACALGGASACGAGAVIASLVFVPVFFNYYHHDQPSLLLPVLIRGAIFVVIGSMAGRGTGSAAGDGRSPPTTSPCCRSSFDPRTTLPNGGGSAITRDSASRRC